MEDHSTQAQWRRKALQINKQSVMVLQLPTWFSLPPVAYFILHWSVRFYKSKVSVKLVQRGEAAGETIQQSVSEDMCCLSSFRWSVCICVCGEETQRCQLVMQQKSASLARSESLSHSPQPFCYITNMPFTKRPASCQMALNHTRRHISTKTSHKNFRKKYIRYRTLGWSSNK